MRRTRPSLSQRPRPSGFSLIELLVVIGIIVLLIGILVPTLGAVRAAARKTQAQVLANQVVNAATMFQSDKRRLPGYFPKSMMAHQDNAQRGGFTENENVLLDLRGGVIADSSVTEMPEEGIYRVGPGEEDQHVLVFVEHPKTGSGDEGYLSVDPESIQRISGQYTPQQVDPSHTFYPEIVDPFGMPLLVFTENKAVNKADRDNYYFGLAYWGNSGDPGQPAASFYWATNSGYVLSRGLGIEGSLRTPQSTQSLSSAATSLLGQAENTGGPTEIGASLAGILGNPGLAANRELNGFPDFATPDAARGSFNVISAGPDRVYFSSKQDPDQDGRVGYVRFDESGTPPGPQPGTAEVSRFDDIIVSGG